MKGLNGGYLKMLVGVASSVEMCTYNCVRVFSYVPSVFRTLGFSFLPVSPKYCS